MPPAENPADWFMDLISGEAVNTETESVPVWIFTSSCMCSRVALLAVPAVAGAKSQNSTVCARDAVRHLGGAVLKFLISSLQKTCTETCIWHTWARLENYTFWQLNKDRVESKSRVLRPAKRKNALPSNLMPMQS